MRTRPQGIACCLDSSDASEAILWAREHEMHYFFHNTPIDRFQVKSAFVEEVLPEQGIEELLRNVDSWPGARTRTAAALPCSLSAVPSHASLKRDPYQA